MPKQPVDPYAPPPMHHDRSGAVVRLAIVGALLGAAAWGYMSYSGGEQTALVEEAPQEQQLADAGGNAGYQVSPSTVTPAAPAPEAAPAAAPAPTPAPRAPRRAPAPASEPAPPPPVMSTPTPIAPTAPTPLPPDVTTGD